MLLSRKVIVKQKGYENVVLTFDFRQKTPAVYNFNELAILQLNVLLRIVF